MAEIYISGRIGNDDLATSSWAMELEDRGHILAHKQWEQQQYPDTGLAFEEAEMVARSMALAREAAIRRSDVFIQFANKNMPAGTSAELGVALAEKLRNDDKELLVVRAGNADRSVFYAHPSVIALRALKEVRQRPWY